MFSLRGGPLVEVDCATTRAPLNFLNNIYDCSMDPSRWATALGSAARLIRGCAAAIVAQTPGESARVEASWKVSTSLERAIVATAPLSPALPAVWLLGVARAFTANALFGCKEVRNSLWHKRVLRPEGLDDVAIVTISKSARSFSMLMIARPHTAGPYVPQDIAKLSALAPYIRRATAIAQLLDYMPLAHHCTSAAFDPMRVGIILTNPSGKILHANTAGEKLLDGCALLCLEDELAARENHGNSLLRQAIADAGRGRSTCSRRGPPIIIKGCGTKSLAVWVAHIDERVRLPVGVSRCARVAVFVKAFDTAERSPAETLLRHHPVSIAESWLLSLLAQGLSLDRAAQALAISMPAARVGLARILRRTDIHDEAELIARLTGRPALIAA